MIKPILLVEDEANDVFFMKRALKAAGASHVLHSVLDGREAISYLKGDDKYLDRATYPLPYLVLLDLKLPHVLGLDVLRWIRAEPKFQCLPVIVFTSSRDERDISSAYAAGANSYLVKPTNSKELVEMVRSLADYWFNHHTVPSHPPE